MELVSLDYLDPYIEPYVRKDAIFYGSSAVPA